MILTLGKAKGKLAKRAQSRLFVKNNDLISISDAPAEGSTQAVPWIVICADDDASAHRATEFALEGELIEGRPVQLISAYSAAQTIEAVRNHPEAAALLLDVVMETPMAGLNAISDIREVIDRRALRIIVRSGGPGAMGELEMIKKFDISDWRPKNELNQARLLSAITLAVRGYEEFSRLDRRSAGLDAAMVFLERLAQDPSSEELMGDLLGEIERLLGSPIWALALEASGSWRVACGPAQERPEGFPGGRAMRGTLLGFDAEAWMGRSGRARKDLGRAAVAGSSLSTSVWTPYPIPDEVWGSEQCRALMRALSSALAGQEKARMEREALMRDPATGMFTRQGFIEKAQGANLGTEAAVFLIDLAGFARVNSALGHEAGDEILREAGKRVQAFAGNFPCGRIASDAFAILMPKASFSAEGIEAIFEEPLATSAFPIPMKPRVSAALATSGESVGAWLTSAAAAMEEAKAVSVSGGDARWFDPRSKSLALDRMALSQKLFAALREKNKKSLFMVFQPQINLADGAVTGCEALIRWKDGDSFVPPDKFIPIAEESGLAMEISEFALSESLAMMKRARTAGLALPRVSVNISPVEFESGDLRGRIEGHLARHGSHASDLMIEITETAAAKDPESMVRILNGLREAGVKVAIDDFGSGYSSLAQLARLPIDELKIDRAFVNALGQHGQFSGIAKMIVDLGSSMRMEVLAEGVEREDQAELLRVLGAHSAQGWLYAKGMPEEEFFTWIMANPDARSKPR